MGFFCDRVRARKNPRTRLAAVKNNDRRCNPCLPRPTRAFKLSYTNYAQIYPQAARCNQPPKRIILYLGSKKTQHVGFSPKIPNHISRQELKLFSCIRGVELNTDLKAQTAYADGSRSSPMRGKTVRVLQGKCRTKLSPIRNTAADQRSAALKTSAWKRRPKALFLCPEVVMPDLVRL